MIGEQIQINQDGTATVACKVPAAWIPLLKLIAASRDAVVNDLLKMCLHFIIETAKVTTAPSPEMRSLLNMMRVDANWASMFNYVGNGKLDVAQAILVLQQSKNGKPCEGYGLALFNKPFMGCDLQTESKEDEGYMTLSKDEILERVVEVCMGVEDYKNIRDIGTKHGCGSIRETLSLMIDAQIIEDLNESDRDELPGYGEFHDFGKMLKYGQKYVRKPHRTPDSVANSQQRIRFDEDDATTTDTTEPYGEKADKYLADLEERAKEEKEADDFEEKFGFRPHGGEW